MIGKILGNRYELLECVGEGGMSFVYKARCRKLNRFVAVKILKDEFKNNEEIVKKFKKEATAIANLSNPNVVNVLDVGTQDDMNYIVMEYIEGKTLKDIIKDKGALPYEVAISIGIKVAKALECAHKSGIVHRDVKPQNILVTEEGVVKVTDFGIAKSMDSSTIAHTNSVMGSAHYFSPEQAKGTYTDYRTDLYSLGIVLYEMVTGVVPFDGDSPVTVAVKHIQEKAIPPKNINRSIPNSLNDLILKAMEKDAVNRYQTAREIISDLEKIKNNPDVVIVPKASEGDEQFTRVMAPVVVPDLDETKKPVNDFDDEDEYDEYDDDDDNDEYEEPSKVSETQKKPSSSTGKKKSSTALIVVATIVVVALGISLGFFGMKRFVEGGKGITIPNVVGAKAEDAKNELEKLGFKILEVTEESDQEKGIVLSTDPAANTSAKKGTEIKLTISGGVSQVKVPNFEGMDLEAVKNTLATLNLELGDVDYDYSNSVTKGQIISQDPGANVEVDKNSKVDVVISKGPEIKVAKVPNLSGKSVDQAKSELEGLGFKVNATKGDTADSSEKSGKVYKQDPAPGYEMREGTTITIVYYGDYVKPKHNAGALVGMTGAQAKEWASKNSITVNGITSDTAKVKSVSNSGDVEEGSSVTVTMEEEKKPEPDKKPETETPEPEKPTDPANPTDPVNPTDPSGGNGNGQGQQSTNDNPQASHSSNKKS